jgi:hypothetical protein
MKDWAELEECTVYCRCGAVFRAKHRVDYQQRISEIDRDCPKCGRRDGIRRASLDPERFTIS